MTGDQSFDAYIKGNVKKYLVLLGYVPWANFF
jgi:hypothetical protein